MSSSQDPFREARESTGVQMTEFNGEKIPFVLRLLFSPPTSSGHYARRVKWPIKAGHKSIKLLLEFGQGDAI